MFLIDLFPIKMCEAIRHARVNLLRDDGAYFGKSTKGWFFGFKLHVLTTRTGQLLGVIFLPTSYDDREGARSLAKMLKEASLCIADLGYRGVGFQTQMYEEEGVVFLTGANIESQSLKITHSLM